MTYLECSCFFFQAEDGIRSHCVTGVQTFALPIFQPWGDLERLPTAGTSLQVHISMGNDSLWDVAKLPHRKTVIYHNITPAIDRKSVVKGKNVIISVERIVTKNLILCITIYQLSLY